MENLIISLNCVLPMFLILCTGFFSRKCNVIPEEAFHHLSTLSFKVLLPCLLFTNVYSADLSTAAQPKLLGFLLLWTLFIFGVSFALYSAIEPDPRRRGAYVQNAYRSNIAVIGLSLGQTMMGESGVASLSVAISILVPLYNVLAVITLETFRGGGVDIKKTIREIFRNPLIRSCILGVICLAFHIHLPAPVTQTIKNLGNAGSVMTLLALGASFHFEGLKQNRVPLIVGTVTRLILSPLAALTAAVLLGFRGDALGVVLICIATPMAASSYPMALACDSDHELTAQLVVSTSLFCSLTIFLWIFLLKQLGLL